MQYVGFMREGRKMIYVNAFLKRIADDVEWRKGETPMFFDGGNALFGVEYDVAEDAFANFHFNGSA